MARLRVLIPAAGTGMRAGLPYPKTLHPVLGVPILIRLLELLRPYDAEPVVIVNPAGRDPVSKCLKEHGYYAELVEQARPSGMGDAILQFAASSGWGTTEHLLTVWGDIPFLGNETVATLHASHFADLNDFTFATRIVEEAYTFVQRDRADRVRALIETRETRLKPTPGERDIGLFLFRVEPVFALLAEELPDSSGAVTGEHGFLYIVRHLVDRGFKVEALPVATERELISLNRLSDLDAVRAFGGRT